MEIKKIMITGCNGTIGTGLFIELLNRGYNVIGVDVNQNKWYEKLNKNTLVVDLTKPYEVENLPTNVDMIIHLAAHPKVYESVINPELAKENVDMTFNILEFARKNGITRFIYASSREIYGNIDKYKAKEEDVDISRCESPYTASKIFGESLVYAYNRCYGINYIIIRFSNVYGKYDDSDRVIPLFIKNAKENKDLVVYGKEKMLDFTYIDDAIDGVIRSIERFDKVKNNTFNIATGRGTYILDLAKTVIYNLNSESNIVIKDSRPGEITRFVADISKAKELLGYHPKTSIEEGIEKSIEWYIENLY